MKLKQDLVRDIVLAIEADTSSLEDTIFLELNNGKSQEISYHVMLLYEAGLLVGQNESLL